MLTIDTPGHVRTLRVGRVIEHGAAGRRYRIVRVLGQGGFGTAYLAEPSGAQVRLLPAQVCLKLTTDVRSWVREAYFGEVLSTVPSAIGVFDQFAVRQPRDHYALVTEFAGHGDLAHFLEHTSRRWSEEKIRREIISILKALDVLHRGAALHRDLTPFNVFVCEGPRLKLGDFGIAKHHLHRAGIPARTMNRWLAPPELYEARRHNWQSQDDVYQVGQLLGMLVRWSVDPIDGPAAIRAMHCSNELKEIIRRCVGKRGKRFDTAGELIAHLRRPRRSMGESRLSNLRGEVVVFTGRLSIPRSRAAALARRAGARVVVRVSGTTTLVVVGTDGGKFVAGDRGQKLIDAAMQRERGHHVRVIREAQFLRLVATPRSA